ncbi:hypothetical protein DRO64_11070 [Candidatus Bathyarchaeota archaeon]|nr:MAG: hypothetical protein DRO64_11070 [Candidatus Bathyarchaeota archaeon]
MIVEGTPVDSTIWLVLTGIFVVVSVGLATLLIIERERSRKNRSLGEANSAPIRIPFATERTISPSIYEEAKTRLRVLDLEREILSYAIRRLYEAHAEGRITEEERDRLVEKYRVDLERIKEEIARGESIVALNELERMREEFIRIFSERFDELTRRIEQLRAMTGLPQPAPQPEEEGMEKPAEEEKEEPKPQPVQKPRRRRKTQIKPPPEPEKPDVEKRVEQIVSEVEKVLKKLGQMEVEE